MSATAPAMTHPEPELGPMLAAIARDSEGYLLDPEDWTPELIGALAAEQEIELTEHSREIVMYVRRYYEANSAVPEARHVLKHMKTIWGKEQATRRYLYQMFPYGYGQQACKIAGMRKPLKLILDV